MSPWIGANNRLNRDGGEASCRKNGKPPGLVNVLAQARRMGGGGSARKGKAVVAHLCQDVAVMQGGRVVEHGPVRQVLREPRHPYTRQLLDAVPGQGVASAA